MRIIRVAIPVPLRQVFDYLPAADTVPEQYQRGQRVLAPFGRRQLAGIVVGSADQADVDEATLKPLLALWDGQALIPEEVLRLCEWAARYYHAPLGEVLAAALPVALRQQQQGHRLGEQAIRLTATGLAIDPETLRRAPRQAALWQRLQAAPVTLVTLREEGFTSTIIRAVKERGLAEECLLDAPPAARPSSPEPPLAPNSAQRAAVQAILQHPGQYQCFLLEGITGSGKTEVYLQAIAGVLDRGQQALVLVPEIGLAPQTVERFQRRFGTQVACYHSGLSEKERQASWHAAASGQARILIGTRSAVFLPLPEPGICIVDEEHDAAFKQQDGFRYHARDIAIKRAFDANIPVVLGSATPSSESLSHAQAHRYHHLHLPERAGHAALPDWRLIDMRQQRSEEGLSSMLLDAIRDTLHNGQQALVFINRRGYAPSLCCPSCGWQAQCPDCSVRMTLHRRPPGLRCHHCDHREPKPGRCPACQNPALMAVGAGTQRSEEVLQRHFPEFPVLRIDRDSTRNPHELARTFARIQGGEPCILVGTQMLAKGHHFPQVTLVGVVDADQGLFSADFRAAERTGQLLLQVAGRAGRGQHPGRVLIQTHLPEHPWLNLLVHGGYRPFMAAVLDERRHCGLPPFGHLALVRAEATDARAVEQVLAAARQSCVLPEGVQLIGPLPALMERRAGRYRFQLLIHSHERGPLHQVLQHLVSHLETHARRLRWGVDVDPQDMS